MSYRGSSTSRRRSRCSSSTCRRPCPCQSWRGRDRIGPASYMSKSGARPTRWCRRPPTRAGTWPDSGRSARSRGRNGCTSRSHTVRPARPRRWAPTCPVGQLRLAYPSCCRHGSRREDDVTSLVAVRRCWMRFGCAIRIVRACALASLRDDENTSGSAQCERNPENSDCFLRRGDMPSPRTLAVSSCLYRTRADLYQMPRGQSRPREMRVQRDGRNGTARVTVLRASSSAARSTSSRARASARRSSPADSRAELAAARSRCVSISAVACAISSSLPLIFELVAFRLRHARSPETTAKASPVRSPASAKPRVSQKRSTTRS